MIYDSPTDIIQITACQSLFWVRFQTHTAEYAFATAVADTGDERFGGILKKNPEVIAKWLDDNKCQRKGLRRFTFSWDQRELWGVSKKNRDRIRKFYLTRQRG